MAMLFAVDIDDTCATSAGTLALVMFLREVMEIDLPLTWQVPPGRLTTEWLQQTAEATSWLERHGPDQLAHLLFEGQYHPTFQALCRPIEGAAETLSRLAEAHRICYVTNRKKSTSRVSSSWLAYHGFPEPHAVFCCGEGRGISDKILYAGKYLAPEEQLIMIDNAAGEYEKALYFLLKGAEREAVAHFLPRMALIGYGETTVPECLFPFPPFPFVAMPDWSHLERTLTTILPFIGSPIAQLSQFYRPDFEPALLRRTRSILREVPGKGAPDGQTTSIATAATRGSA